MNSSRHRHTERKRGSNRLDAATAPGQGADRPLVHLLCIIATGTASVVCGEETVPETALDTVVVSGAIAKPTTPAPSARLEGESLRQAVGDTLGRTLEQQLGVRNASFGPGVGIPVIRGLTGARIRTLQDGIGSHDAAAVSPDHAVTIEPLLADSIEILRGPATVRYGGSAIGGVVNVGDGRIPNRPPQHLIGGAAELRYGDNGGATAAVAKLDAGDGPFALHLDGYRRRRGDLEIPGEAIDHAAVAEQFGLTGVQSSRRKIRNTDTFGQGGSVGASLSGERFLLGMAVNHLVNAYGVPPGGHGAAHSHGGAAKHGENVRIDMAQTRFDFKAEWYAPFRFAEKASLRIGVVDYRHDEIDLGVRSTRFLNGVIEGRFEIPLRWNDYLSGLAGVQWIDRRFSATGTETFAPPTDIDLLAGFLTQKLTLGTLSVELGARKESQTTDPLRDRHRVATLFDVQLPKRLDFSPHSLSAAVEFAPVDGLTGRLGYSWGERAPEVQELLSVGPHMATRSFDVGNVALGLESSQNLDLGVVWTIDAFELKLNGYHNRIHNYIYLANQGYFYDAESQRLQLQCAQLDRCLPVYGYQQASAELTGYEAELSVALPEAAGIAPRLRLFSDYVRGRFDDPSLGDVPRLPPLRYGVELSGERGGWSAAFRVTRNDKQNRPGLFETPTAGYLLLGANLAYRLNAADERSISVFVRGDNLLNEEVRNSVSFLRNFAPEPGRSVELGLRAQF